MRCPRGQRRIEGKCVYPKLVKDCRAVVRKFRRGADLKPMIDNLLEDYALDEETAEGRAKDSRIYGKKKVRWDDVYYVMLGAGEGW